MVEFVPMVFPPKLMGLDQQVDFTYPVAIQYYRFMMPYPEKEESSYRFSAILRPFNSKVMPTALILFSDSTGLNLMGFFKISGLVLHHSEYNIDDLAPMLTSTLPSSINSSQYKFLSSGKGWA